MENNVHLQILTMYDGEEKVGMKVNECMFFRCYHQLDRNFDCVPDVTASCRAG